MDLFERKIMHAAKRLKANLEGKSKISEEDFQDSVLEVLAEEFDWFHYDDVTSWINVEDLWQIFYYYNERLKSELMPESEGFWYNPETLEEEIKEVEKNPQRQLWTESLNSDGYSLSTMIQDALKDTGFDFSMAFEDESEYSRDIPQLGNFHCRPYGDDMAILQAIKQIVIDTISEPVYNEKIKPQKESDDVDRLSGVFKDAPISIINCDKNEYTKFVVLVNDKEITKEEIMMKVRENALKTGTRVHGEKQILIISDYELTTILIHG